MDSQASSMSSSSNPETVTSVTARTLDPGKAVAMVIRKEGLLYSLWRLVMYLPEALGFQSAKKIDQGYANVDLDKIVARGRFPYRPSDLFLKVVHDFDCW